MIDPSRLHRIQRHARAPTNWHRGHPHESWMNLPGMYGVVHARQDPVTKKWIAWVKNGEHSYPACKPQTTRTAAAVRAAELASAEGFHG